MTSSSKELKHQLNDFQLTVEEILGGMDLAIKNLERRVSALEQTPQCHNLSLEIQKLERKVDAGFDLTFRKLRNEG